MRANNKTTFTGAPKKINVALVNTEWTEHLALLWLDCVSKNIFVYSMLLNIIKYPCIPSLCNQTGEQQFKILLTRLLTLKEMLINNTKYLVTKNIKKNSTRFRTEIKLINI